LASQQQQNQQHAHSSGPRQVFVTPGGHTHTQDDLLGGYTPQVSPVVLLYARVFVDPSPSQAHSTTLLQLHSCCGASKRNRPS
jgi:hypothetical protein